MEVIPAIDLRGGKCVRLLQGRYDRETVFSDDPVAVAARWQSQGARRLHIVDLDGAKEGEPRNLEVLSRILHAVDIPVQFGGGIRNQEIARRVLDLGVQRVIIGTAALDAVTAAQIIEALGDSLAVAIDAREGRVSVRGWLETTEVQALDLARQLDALGARCIIFTDITHDGMLTGPNTALLAELIATANAAVIASGGIATIEHLRAVRDAGAAGAIIGMALYSGQLDLKEALTAVC